MKDVYSKAHITLVLDSGRDPCPYRTLWMNVTWLDFLEESIDYQ